MNESKCHSALTNKKKLVTTIIVARVQPRTSKGISDLTVNMKADRVNISCHFLFKSKFGKVSRLLFTVATGAVSQAPSPVSNPNSPDPLLSS
ncbi:hypothetical protein M0813_30090 [Anaeramoeba flamelloides]|uniref:Uncharacterized protein n=1 Tax=Anaeramoeba flamelloides TaxID=1746091 RepID=A0ABQ8XNJ6_9EUKA|nr:hypothetical protein M0813_30090 [Anaeramoeba flamelloides]